MKKEDFKYILSIMIFIVIIVIIFKFIFWLLPYALIAFAIYLGYLFVIKVKDRTITLSKENQNDKKNKVQEAEIVKEKNE